MAAVCEHGAESHDGTEPAMASAPEASRAWLLIEHPGRMTHASVAGSALEVPADLIRLSVGIEDCDDLIDDLRQALARIMGSPPAAAR